MARFAFSLAAIMILIFSAGLTHGQLQPPLRAAALSAASLNHNTDAFRAEVALLKRAVHVEAAPIAPNEEPPAPALLVYLALILVGGAAAVALAHRRLRNQS
jgi:hypothetical protein